MSDTKASFDSKVPGASGIDLHLREEAWRSLGRFYVGIVELEVSERTEPSDDEADRKIKLRIVNIELVDDNDTQTRGLDEELRRQLRDMHERRVTKGSLFENVTITKNGIPVDATLQPITP